MPRGLSITIYMPIDLYIKLSDLADKKKKSLSQFIVELLEKGLSEPIQNSNPIREIRIPEPKPLIQPDGRVTYQCPICLSSRGSKVFKTKEEYMRHYEQEHM